MIALAYLWLNDAIPVDREDPESREKVKQEIARMATNGENVLIFPEGTSTNCTMLLRFKEGAYHAMLPVQPITLQYHFDDGLNNVCWSHHSARISSLLILTLCKFYTGLTLTMLPPFMPSKEVTNAK